MRSSLTFWLAALALLLAPSAAAAQVRLGTLDAAGARAVAAESLRPGLRVSYAHAYFNHIDEMAAWERTVDGEPVATLAAKAADGPVLTSQEREGVGATMGGFLHLAKPGVYAFKVNSNDGVRIRLGDKLLYEDPFRHAARMSDELVVEVEKPGWYPLKVTYYQAKGTWTLELYWRPPGAADFAYVPAEAFAHLDKTAADPVLLAREEAERILAAARAEAATIVAAARKEAADIKSAAGKKPSN